VFAPFLSQEEINTVPCALLFADSEGGSEWVDMDIPHRLRREKQWQWMLTRSLHMLSHQVPELFPATTCIADRKALRVLIVMTL
jgi:hypothetical protein